MNWFEDFKDDLSEVFVEAERIIAAFPAPLNVLGLDYLAKFNVFHTDSSKNYVCYLLPFWLTDLTLISSEENRKLSLANVFIMLYFFIQDDWIDSTSPQPIEQLPLGNLFILEYLDIYKQYFPSDSPFWSFFKEYVTEWAESVANERNQNYFINNIRMIAKKAGPVKLASTGALLLSNQADLIPKLSDSIDHVLITLQMVDDWVDWKEDLEQKNYNSLLAMLKAQLQLRYDQELTVESVKKSIFIQGFLNDYVKTAEANHVYLHGALGLNAPHLLAFHSSLIQHLTDAAAKIEREKQALALGGFQHFLFRHKSDN
jgi:hypothetical protein